MRWKSYLGSRKWLLPLSLSLNLVGVIVACTHPPLTGTPKWDGLMWSGQPDIGGIERTQDDPVSQLSASDGRFKQYVCMTYEDLSCMYFSFVNNCRDWYTLTPSCPKFSDKDVRKMIRDYERDRQQVPR